MTKYKYTGQTPIMIYGVGLIEPGSEFKSGSQINHPLIKEVKDKPKQSKSSKVEEK